jgi:hypothetical protein
MMGLVVEQQRRMQADFERWEKERETEHALAMARFREESTRQQRRTVGAFVHLLRQCNAVLTDALGKDDDNAAAAAEAPVTNDNEESSNTPK